MPGPARVANHRHSTVYRKIMRRHGGLFRAIDRLDAGAAGTHVGSHSAALPPPGSDLRRQRVRVVPGLEPHGVNHRESVSVQVAQVRAVSVAGERHGGVGQTRHPLDAARPPQEVLSPCRVVPGGSHEDQIELVPLGVTVPGARLSIQSRRLKAGEGHGDVRIGRRRPPVSHVRDPRVHQPSTSGSTATTRKSSAR